MSSSHHTAEATLTNDRAHVFHSWSAQAQITPVAIAGAEGSWMWDFDGNRYLDFSSQLINVNLGHQHPKLVAAIQEAAGRLCTVAPIHAGPNGHFAVSVRALRSTQLRLAYNGVAGDAVPLTVTPRVTLRADGRTLRVLVSPRLPLQVQRLTQNAWRSVARTTGSFKRSLKPGSYRVKVLGVVGYSPAVSRPVGVH